LSLTSGNHAQLRSILVITLTVLGKIGFFIMRRDCMDDGVSEWHSPCASEQGYHCRPDPPCQGLNLNRPKMNIIYFAVQCAWNRTSVSPLIRQSINPWKEGPIFNTSTWLQIKLTIGLSAEHCPFSLRTQCFTMFSEWWPGRVKLQSQRLSRLLSFTRAHTFIYLDVAMPTTAIRDNSMEIFPS